MAARAVGVTDEEIVALGEGVLAWARTYMEGCLEENPLPGLETPPSIEGLIVGAAGLSGLFNTPRERAAEIVQRHLFALFEGRLLERRESETWMREQLEGLAEGS